MNHMSNTLLSMASFFAREATSDEIIRFTNFFSMYQIGKAEQQIENEMVYLPFDDKFYALKVIRRL